MDKIRPGKFRDIIALLEDGDMSVSQIENALKINRDCFKYCRKLLVQKGIIRQFPPRTNMPNTVNYLEKYIWYRVICYLDGVICPEVIDAQENDDLSIQYKCLYMYAEAESIKKLLYNAASVTFISHRNKKYEDITREWITDNLNLHKVYLVFIDKKDKFDEIKMLHDRLDQLFYNLYLDIDEMAFEKISEFETDRKIRNKKILSSHNELLHTFNLKKEKVLLSLLYDEYLAVKFSKPV